MRFLPAVVAALAILATLGLPVPTRANNALVITEIKGKTVKLTDAKGKCPIKVPAATLQKYIGKRTQKDPASGRLLVPYAMKKTCNSNGKWWATSRFIKTDANIKWDCTKISTSTRTASGGSGYGGGCNK